VVFFALATSVTAPSATHTVCFAAIEAALDPTDTEHHVSMLYTVRDTGIGALQPVLPELEDEVLDDDEPPELDDDELEDEELEDDSEPDEDAEDDVLAEDDMLVELDVLDVLEVLEVCPDEDEALELDANALLELEDVSALDETDEADDVDEEVVDDIAIDDGAAEEEDEATVVLEAGDDAELAPLDDVPGWDENVLILLVAALPAAPPVPTELPEPELQPTSATNAPTKGTTVREARVTVPPCSWTMPAGWYGRRPWSDS